MFDALHILARWFEHHRLHYQLDEEQQLLRATFAHRNGSLNLVSQPFGDNMVLLEVVGLETITSSEESALSVLTWLTHLIGLARNPANGELRARMLIPLSAKDVEDPTLEVVFQILLGQAALARDSLRLSRDNSAMESTTITSVEEALFDFTEVEYLAEVFSSLPLEAGSLLQELIQQQNQVLFVQRYLGRFNDSVLTSYSKLLYLVNVAFARSLWRLLEVVWDFRQQREFEFLPSNMQRLVLELLELEKNEDLTSAFGLVEICRELLKHFDRARTPALLSRTEATLGQAHKAIYILTTNSDNADRAELAYRHVMGIKTRETAPSDWAQTQRSLASLYRTKYERTGKERYADVARAIYHEALATHTRDVAPAEWAGTQNNLGNLLSLLYERTSEQYYAEESESAYRGAMEVLTRENAPSDWAQTQSNLGVLLSLLYERTREERFADEAASTYRAALAVRTREATPFDYALTQCCLANLVSRRYAYIGEERFADEAASTYRAALAVHTREAAPSEWAQTQMGQSGLLSLRYQRTGDESYADGADMMLRSVLEVYTREDAPILWAQTQRNLGGLLLARYKQTGKELYADEAEKALRGALGVFDPLVEPAYVLTPQQHLAQLLVLQEKWPQAEVAYADAIQTAELQYLAAPSDAERRLLMKEHVVLYQEHAYCLLRMGDTVRAFVRLDEGRARGLSEVLGLEQAAYAAHGEQGVVRLRALRQDLRAAEALLDDAITQLRASAPGAAYSTAAAKRDKESAEVRTAYSNLRTEIRILGLEQPILTSEMVRSPLPPNIAVLALLSGSNTCALVLHEGNIHHVALPNFEQRYVSSLFRSWPPPTNNWADAYLNRVNAAQILQGIPENDANNSTSRDSLNEAEQDWLRALDEIATTHGNYDAGWYSGYQFAFYLLERDYHPTAEWATRQAWKGIVARTVDALRERFWTPIKAVLPENVEKVLLLVGGEAALLPLHAAAGELTVAYAPSLGVWFRCQEAAIERETNSLLLATPAPPEDLTFTAAEVEWLTHRFDDIGASEPFLEPLHLNREEATVERVVGASTGKSVVHFSGHATYNWAQPLHSGLLCYDGILTLAHIRQGMDLRANRLVVLSACSTGMSDIFGSGEEWVGLPAGLLEAGAPAVVASLWPVNDLSTAFLMDRFYTLWLDRKRDRTIAGALREAAEWLRDVNWTELGERVAASDLSYELRNLLNDLLKKMLMSSATKLPDLASGDFIIEMSRANPEEKPFAAPYYWAAFASYGAVL
jgi:hypothetical protein